MAVRMAQEVECAQIVLDLRKKNPALKLHALLPCEGQEGKWSVTKQEIYHTILEQADDVVVSQTYHSACESNPKQKLIPHRD